MVFAEGVEGDVLFQEKFRMGHIELFGEMLLGIAVHAGEELCVHFGAAFWCFCEAWAVGIFANGDEEIADGFFCFFNIYHDTSILSL